MIHARYLKLVSLGFFVLNLGVLGCSSGPDQRKKTGTTKPKADSQSTNTDSADDSKDSDKDSPKGDHPANSEEAVRTGDVDLNTGAAKKAKDVALVANGSKNDQSKDVKNALPISPIGLITLVVPYEEDSYQNKVTKTEIAQKPSGATSLSSCSHIMTGPNNALIEKSTCHWKTSGEEYVYITEYTYSASFQLIAILRQNSGSGQNNATQIKYEYDEKKRIITDTTTLNGANTTRITYTYPVDTQVIVRHFQSGKYYQGKTASDWVLSFESTHDLNKKSVVMRQSSSVLNPIHSKEAMPLPVPKLEYTITYSYEIMERNTFSFSTFGVRSISEVDATGKLTRVDNKVSIEKGYLVTVEPNGSQTTMVLKKIIGPLAGQVTYKPIIVKAVLFRDHEIRIGTGNETVQAKSETRTSVTLNEALNPTAMVTESVTTWAPSGRKVTTGNQTYSYDLSGRRLRSAHNEQRVTGAQPWSSDTTYEY